ncbi:MAG: pseudouridine synthase [Rickettsiaceae bacterium]|jgi:23S rRNA (guanosine2251-2'-O)-methyltransferase|nr:pseudouridine synthase [Rickettsiaceae bacterium]
MTQKNKLISKTDNQIWIYGRHPVLAALLNPRRKIYQILVTPHNEADLKKFITDKKIKIDKSLIKIVDGESLSSLFPIGSTHQGFALKTSLITIFSFNHFLDKIQNLDSKNLPPLLVLDNLTDPQNIGAVIRSAVAFGFKNIVVNERNFPIHSPVIAKAASGMLELVELIAGGNFNHLLSELKKLGYWSVGLDGTAKADVKEVKNFQPIALVLGSEGEGIRRLVKENCDLLVKIPISNETESLNASNAAAIAMYKIYAG